MTLVSLRALYCGFYLSSVNLLLQPGFCRERFELVAIFDFTFKPKSIFMKNSDLKIIWSADSSDYIIENGLRYELSTFLSLQLKYYIKQTVMDVSDVVNVWFHSLDPEDQAEVKIIHLN